MKTMRENRMAVTELIPGMRRGAHIWNLIVLVAYLVFLPLLVPIALACFSDRVPVEC